MPQTASIPTSTDVTLNGANVTIYTYYDDQSVPHLIGALITDIVETIDGVDFIEGELAIRFRHSNYASHTDCVLSGQTGELTIISYDTDYPASIYDVDQSSGELSITV